MLKWGGAKVEVHCTVLPREGRGGGRAGRRGSVFEENVTRAPLGSVPVRRCATNSARPRWESSRAAMPLLGGVLGPWDGTGERGETRWHGCKGSETHESGVVRFRAGVHALPIRGYQNKGFGDSKHTIFDRISMFLEDFGGS